MSFFFGGDKRDRTADLLNAMLEILGKTARFRHILGSFVSTGTMRFALIPVQLRYEVLGFERAGFKAPVANEFDPTIYATFKINHPNTHLIIDEIKRANSADHAMPRKMVEYLIGTNDYYKVVSRDGKRLTIIHTFNMHGTLNKSSNVKISAITVPVVKLPTELVTVKFKTGRSNTVEMYLNNGWGNMEPYSFNIIRQKGNTAD